MTTSCWTGDSPFLRELCAHHVSGRLKVAPEHVSPRVLALMGKPSRAVYDRFVQKFEAVNRSLGLRQFLQPYLMSSHPGSDMAAAIALAEYLRDIGYQPEQVQDFYPTPGTLSTCMFHTGLDPRTMQPVYVPTSAHEKAMQRALMQFGKPRNYPLVREALRLAAATTSSAMESAAWYRRSARRAGPRRAARGRRRPPAPGAVRDASRSLRVPPDGFPHGLCALRHRRPRPSSRSARRPEC